jgi:hypothetical protein
LVNPISAWDLLNESRVHAGQWLAVTAGNSTVATMVLQFAKFRKVNVISIIRRAQKDLDLKALGASEVIELSSLSGDISEQIMEITVKHAKLLREIVDISGRPEFRVPVGRLHPLEDFQSAINETANHQSLRCGSAAQCSFLVSWSTRFEKCACSVDFLQFQNFRASNRSLAICTKACNLQNDYR